MTQQRRCTPLLLDGKALLVSWLEGQSLNTRAGTVEQALAEWPQSGFVRARRTACRSGGERMTVWAEDDRFYRTPKNFTSTAIEKANFAGGRHIP
jgi:hypothetical protein